MRRRPETVPESAGPFERPQPGGQRVHHRALIGFGPRHADADRLMRGVAALAPEPDALAAERWPPRVGVGPFDCQQYGVVEPGKAPRVRFALVEEPVPDAPTTPRRSEHRLPAQE